MNRGHQTQIDKYGGEEGYRKEMTRRRSLVKHPTGFALMDKGKLHDISVKGGKKSKRGKTVKIELEEPREDELAA